MINIFLLFQIIFFSCHSFIPSLIHSTNTLSWVHLVPTEAQQKVGLTVLAGEKPSTLCVAGPGGVRLGKASVNSHVGVQNEEISKWKVTLEMDGRHFLGLRIISFRQEK